MSMFYFLFTNKTYFKEADFLYRGGQIFIGANKLFAINGKFILQATILFQLINRPDKTNQIAFIDFKNAVFTHCESGWHHWSCFAIHY